MDLRYFFCFDCMVGICEYVSMDIKVECEVDNTHDVFPDVVLYNNTFICIHCRRDVKICIGSTK